jgi:serine/threonine protein kinase
MKRLLASGPPAHRAPSFSLTLPVREFKYHNGVELPALGLKVGKFEKCGEGGYSVIYTAPVKIDTGQITAAIKESCGEPFHTLGGMEFDQLNQLSHPNIVHVLGELKLPDDEAPVHLLFRERHGHSLTELIYKAKDGTPFDLSSNAFWGITTQLLSTLNYLESDRGNILHRDVVLSNILYDPETQVAKLCDFGVALPRKSSEETVNADMVMAPQWRAPEVWAYHDQDKTLDSWGLGMILLELVTQDMVFDVPDSETEALDVIARQCEWLGPPPDGWFSMGENKLKSDEAYVESHDVEEDEEAAELEGIRDHYSHIADLARRESQGEFQAKPSSDGAGAAGPRPVIAQFRTYLSTHPEADARFQKGCPTPELKNTYERLLAHTLCYPNERLTASQLLNDLP